MGADHDDRHACAMPCYLTITFAHPLFSHRLDFEINGARLTLQPTTAGFKKTNGKGESLCSGPHVEVNTDGVCSPKIEVLGVGDRQIRLVRDSVFVYFILSICVAHACGVALTIQWSTQSTVSLVCLHEYTPS